MNCARLRQVLDAWADGELDPATGTEIEEHLQACAACASLGRERDALRERVQADAPRHRAPLALRRAVRRSVAALADERVRADAPRRRLNWAHAAALCLVTAVMGALTGYWAGRPASDHSLREQVVASHVASLGSSSRLADVASADRHEVKPWFQGRVDFAPTVRDLSAHGYTLLGGRVDHVVDRQAAAIVYRVRNHVVSLFVWRSTGADEPVTAARAHGFNVITWSEAGLGHAAVSDADAAEVERFARLVQSSP